MWSTHEHVPGAEARRIQDGLGVVLVRSRVRACERCESISALINVQVVQSDVDFDSLVALFTEQTTSRLIFATVRIKIAMAYRLFQTQSTRVNHLDLNRIRFVHSFSRSFRLERRFCGI